MYSVRKIRSGKAGSDGDGLRECKSEELGNEILEKPREESMLCGGVG